MLLPHATQYSFDLRVSFKMLLQNAANTKTEEATVNSPEPASENPTAFSKYARK
jgi:hypothetical protein